MKHKRPAEIGILLGYLVLAAGLGLAAVVWRTDALLFFLIIPVVVAPLFCQRAVFLTMEFIAIAVGGLVVHKIFPLPLLSVKTILAVSAALFAITEILYRLRTERERMENALRESEQRFRALIENSSDGIALFDADGIVRYSSPAISRMLGLSANEVGGANVLDRVHEEDLPAAREKLKELLATPGGTVWLQFRKRHKNGSWIWIEATAANLLREPSVEAVVVNFRDVTERLSLEAQLRHSQKLEAVGRLSAGLAHDFNNVLTVIQGHVSLLLSRAKLDRDARSSMERVVLAAERATQLISQLLAFSRKRLIQTRPLDVGEVIANLSKMLRGLLGEAIELQVNRPSRLPLVDADIGVFEQVVLNLALNARDAMPKGGRLVIDLIAIEIDEAYVRHHQRARPGQFVCLTVMDTGCGMDAATLGRVFEPFFTTKAAGKGTGLGLATVYGTIRQHQGWIEVESEVGSGTTFRIFLPASTRTAEPGAHPAPMEKGKLGTETILLAEDDPAVRELVREALTVHGYRVFEAADGRQALEVYDQRRDQIDLLLTDLVMPAKPSGIELADRLKAASPRLKVVYNSGYRVDAQTENPSIREGVNFLAKPFNPTALVATVRKCLDSDETSSV
ncbi:MAG: PAS domain S-box protein [Verrucomicrobia bacterium]|nr:PAS domain S-box protein [Verrucomicrobiota bacterium]